MSCTHDPRQLAGQPIGMYHCPECGEMVVAGMPHGEPDSASPTLPDCMMPDGGDPCRGYEDMAAQLRKAQAEIAMWRARCISLFWSGKADEVTAGKVREAAAEIERLFSHREGSSE